MQIARWLDGRMVDLRTIDDSAEYARHKYWPVVEVVPSPWPAGAGRQIVDTFTGAVIERRHHVVWPTLAAAKVARLAEVDDQAANLRRQIVGSASGPEMATWTTKEREARAYLETQDAAVAPRLQAEAEHRGVTLAALAEKVVGNAEKYWALEAAIAGAAGRLSDTIKTMTEAEEILQYDIVGPFDEIRAMLEAT